MIVQVIAPQIMKKFCQEEDQEKIMIQWEEFQSIMKAILINITTKTEIYMNKHQPKQTTPFLQTKFTNKLKQIIQNAFKK